MTIQQRKQSIILAGLVLLSVAFACPATLSAKPPGADGNASFPEVSDSWSPDGRFVLKNVDSPRDPQSAHSIILTDMQTGQRAVLYSYLRKVDLLWSPASDALAINDWDSTDAAQCIVFRLVPRRERIGLDQDLAKSRPRDGEKKLVTERRDYDHNCVRIIRWLDAKTLLLDLEGHRPDDRRSSSFRLQKPVIR